MQKRNFLDQEGQIVIPKIKVKYEPKVTFDETKVFTGNTVTLPEVMLDYLNSAELKVFKHIYKHIREHGHCITRLATLANEVDATPQAVHQIMKNLEDLGVIFSEKSGRRVERVIDFAAIEKLDQYVKELKPGAVSFMRRKYGSRSISGLVSSDDVKAEVVARYENRPYDPIEDEEYG